MFDKGSDIATILITTVFIIIIWRFYVMSSRDRSHIKSVISTDEVRLIEDISKDENTTMNRKKIIEIDTPDLIRVPRAHIIRQPFPVGEPALPISTPTVLTQDEIDYKYGLLLPFSNPPPPNGPAFSGGYGPAEVPVPTGYMAPDATIENVFPEFTGAGGFRL